MENSNKSRVKLGITGGIGSGKTSVCKVFNILGIPVFSADEEARWIMEHDDKLMVRLNSLAGKNLYQNGVLDRSALATLIFNNGKLLEKVNLLVHPAVFDRFKIWTDNQNAPYVIMEAAILVESGGAAMVDKVAVVTAPVEERISRVMLRNGLTREQVVERINNQSNEAELLKSADFVIKNSEIDMIIPSVLNIHEKILNQIKTFS